jgi:pyrroline-5-carboxylate reductase
MIAGGVQTGLDLEVATELVQQTIRGAAELLVQDERSATELREAVTSKGGTTDAAITVMQDRGFSDIVGDGVVSARDRGVELGKS